MIEIKPPTGYSNREARGTPRFVHFRIRYTFFKIIYFDIFMLM